MKTLHPCLRAGLLAAALCLIASPVLRAEGSPEQKPAKALSAGQKKYDKDGDGKLSDEEKAAYKAARDAAMLEKYDANKDGKLDDAEKAAMKADKEKPKKEKKAE